MLLTCAGLQALPFSSLAATYTIDVLGVYSNHAAQEVVDPRALFASNIEYANRALQNSGANYRYNLVEVVQQNWAKDDLPGLEQLSSIADDANVKQLRDEYGADLVAGMVPSSSESCGIAYMPSADMSIQQFYSWAERYGYSLSGHNCGGRTMAHELGHTMGLGHSPAQGSNGALAAWGRGWGVNGSFVTIMAYGEDYGVRNAAGRIQIHSNPAVSICNSQACGRPINESDGADATRALNLAAPQIADWRDAVVGLQNDPPAAVNDNATTDQDKAVTLSVLKNDSDPDGDALMISSVGGPSNGQAVLHAQTNRITYTPYTGFEGQDSFSYTIMDGKGASASATVRITVKAVVVTPPSGGDGDNLIVNGGAESGLDGWSGAWGAQLALSGDAHSGSKALRGSGGRGIFVELDAPFTGNKNFVASGWLKATRPNRTYLYLRVKSDGRWSYKYLSTIEVLANTWMQFERISYVSGSNIDAGALLLYFHPKIDGNILVDGLRLEQE